MTGVGSSDSPLSIRANSVIETSSLPRTLNKLASSFATLPSAEGEGVPVDNARLTDMALAQLLEQDPGLDPDRVGVIDVTRTTQGNTVVTFGAVTDSRPVNGDIDLTAQEVLQGQI